MKLWLIDAVFFSSNFSVQLEVTVKLKIVVHFTCNIHNSIAPYCLLHSLTILLKGPKFRALAHNTNEFHKPQLTPFIHNEYGCEVLTYQCAHICTAKRLKKKKFWKVLFLILVYPLLLVQ